MPSEKYTAQISSHQEGLRREGKCTDQKSLYIKSLQTDYLNLDSSSGYGTNNEIANPVQKKCTFCGSSKHSAEKYFKYIIMDQSRSSSR